VETYLVKPEEREKFKSLIQRLLRYKKENQELFKEVKSLKIFAQTFGGIAGAHIEMWEFGNMADLEKCWAKENKDERFRRMHQEFLQLIEPVTFSINVWSEVAQSL